MDSIAGNATITLISSKFEGVRVIENSKLMDVRGSFERIYDHAEIFGQKGEKFVQSSLSRNTLAGTLRGLHFQKSPSGESKLITCIKGRLLDVLVDIRLNSPTYGGHLTFELSEESPVSLLVPPGVAHGFQTLKNDTWVLYHMTERHQPELDGRLLYSDSELKIAWPLQVTVVSKEDEAAPGWPIKF